MTGGGTYCQGGAGVPVGLSGSQTNVIYRLNRNSVYTGQSAQGTGSAVSFGLSNRTRTIHSYSNKHDDSLLFTNVRISLGFDAAFTFVFNVTGGGAYCSGGNGLNIGLSGSQSGIRYDLYRNGSFLKHIREWHRFSIQFQSANHCWNIHSNGN
jgi:hypothetical protein